MPEGLSIHFGDLFLALLFGPWPALWVPSALPTDAAPIRHTELVGPAHDAHLLCERQSAKSSPGRPRFLESFFRQCHAFYY